MKSCPASLVSAIAFFGSSLPLWPQFGISFGFVESTAAGRAIGLNGGQESGTCLSLMIFVYLWPVIVKLVHKADCFEATLVELRHKGTGILWVIK